MKTNIRTIAVAALVSIASLCSALHAQTATIYARFNVPFSFDCGKTHLSAGVYTMTVEDGRVLVLGSSRNQSILALVQMDYAATRSSRTLATFTKYGDRYFLAGITERGNNASVSESGAEKRAARELAMRGEVGTQVALAMLPVDLRRPGN
jgi:hypothetical protein